MKSVPEALATGWIVKQPLDPVAIAPGTDLTASKAI